MQDRAKSLIWSRQLQVTTTVGKTYNLINIYWRIINLWVNERQPNLFNNREELQNKCLHLFGEFFFQLTKDLCKKILLLKSPLHHNQMTLLELHSTYKGPKSILILVLHAYMHSILFGLCNDAQYGRNLEHTTQINRRLITVLMYGLKICKALTDHNATLVW